MARNHPDKPFARYADDPVAHTAKTLFRKLFDVSGQVILTNSGITVELTRRAHNPLLVEAGLIKKTVIVPWLQGRSLHISLD